MPALDASLGPAPHTVGSALRELTAELKRAGIEGAGDDVRRLLADVLGASSAGILREPERPLSAAQLDTLRALRRAPQAAASRCRASSASAISTAAPSPSRRRRSIPRPDSETLIARGAGDRARRKAGRRVPLRILDVGTGTGCLLVTLLCELPHATGLGSDISEAALATACDNARSLGVDVARASWVRADALEGIAGPFHMLVGKSTIRAHRRYRGSRT